MAQITLKLEQGQTEDQEQDIITRIERMNGIALLDWAYPDDLGDAELRLIYEANLNDLAHVDELVAAISVIEGVECASTVPELKPIIRGPSPG